MKSKIIAILLLAIIPLTLSADVLLVPLEYATITRAKKFAHDNDTLLIDDNFSYNESDLYGSGLYAIVQDIEPPDAPHDASIYGPADFFPHTPTE